MSQFDSLRLIELQMNTKNAFATRPNDITNCAQSIQFKILSSLLCFSLYFFA